MIRVTLQAFLIPESVVLHCLALELSLSSSQRSNKVCLSNPYVQGTAPILDLKARVC